MTSGSLIILNQHKKNDSSFYKNGTERRYKYKSNHSKELLIIAAPKKLKKSLKILVNLVKLHARGEKTSVPTFLSPLTLQKKKKDEPSAIKHVSLLY